MCSAKEVLLSLKHAPECTEHFVAALDCQGAQFQRQKRLMPPKSTEVWWNSKTHQLPTLFAEPVLICMEDAATIF